MNFTILQYDTIPSTNTEAIAQAKLGADEGLCIVARQQTEGRGRHGRIWLSPKDAGLYLSVVLRPKLGIQHVSLITLAAGVAVYETLAELDIRADIKWVNDVLVGGRKIGGILGETAETPQGLAVILGIGINITDSGFPPVIADKATAVSSHTKRKIAPGNLVEPLTSKLDHYYQILLAENGPQRIVEEWGKRSSYFKGKAVKVIQEGSIVRGVTDGLEPSGALRVISEEGSVRLIQAGHVELLRETAA